MRLDQIIRNRKSNRKPTIDDISFIIPNQPIEMFGKTFESMDEVTAYCDKNDIPYTKKCGIFGYDTYEFPTANN